MIFALALASNSNACKHLNWALQQLQNQGMLLAVSSAYEMKCRDDVGADYLNAACLFESKALELSSLQVLIRDLELMTGRIRPSHQITLDIDLIAWKTQDIQPWQYNTKKMPFALDVKIPLYDILPIATFHVSHNHNYIQLKYDFGGYQQ
ncbi:2-amino-4-hydroxy-6-hydroxymethyldihydropteridinediphosphokinase [Acinetobacter boissieri]|uniref:2-amino-4-hydroxy-6-hydroxymethyldihydropteridine diphosphokinase n=2 Tax=Acinetobacter boissieri TaxID=1219383 RepID=A0A1G6I9K6_9GAMM|nr:2-amino-4-hydroxy-6-hydroxymethyldihydropteridinediphosphokinase [Acinetobacter boissieri]